MCLPDASSGQSRASFCLFDDVSLVSVLNPITCHNDIHQQYYLRQ